MPILMGLLAGWFVVLGLLIWALRGRGQRVEGACRRCGYDVSRRPAGSSRCSECGADLTARRAITTIQRVRRPIWASVAAVALLVLSVPLFTGLWYFPWRRTIAAHAPIAVVVRVAQVDRGPNGEAFRQAWRVREGTTPEFLDHLLDLQRDLSVPLTTTGRYGQTLEIGRLPEYAETGVLSEAQAERFLEQMFSEPVTFRVRTPVRIGDPLIVSASSPLRLHARNKGLKTTFAARVGAPAEIGDRTWSLGGFSDGMIRDIPWKRWGDESLRPGRQTLHIAMRREVADHATMKPVSKPFDAEGRLEIELLPRDAELGTPQPDPAKADEIARAILPRVFHWHDDRVFAEVRLQPAAVDRAFTIYAVIDGLEKRIGSVAAMAGSSGTSDHVYVPIAKEAAVGLQSITLVCVGDGDALKETLNQQGYWPGRITFPDIPLEPYSNAYQRPAALTSQPYEVTPAE